MQEYRIAEYNYCNPDDFEKDKFYRGHVKTEEERNKTQELNSKLTDFVIKTLGENSLKSFYMSEQSKIQYREDLGYILIGNYDRDIVSVFGYGKTLEEAFISILIDYEFFICSYYECSHRKMLNKQYSDRFLDGVYSEKDYHGPFFFAELALQEFRKYYGENIPERIINHYENYLKEVEKCDYKYDYETNSLVLINEKRKHI